MFHSWQLNMYTLSTFKTHLLNQARAGLWLACAWFFEIAFVREVGMRVCMRACVCVRPEAINYIHVILNLYNQLNKFVAFRNVMKLSMHGRGFCNEAQHDRNQGISLRGWF